MHNLFRIFLYAIESVTWMSSYSGVSVERMDCDTLLSTTASPDDDGSGGSNLFNNLLSFFVACIFATFVI